MFYYWNYPNTVSKLPEHKAETCFVKFIKTDAGKVNNCAAATESSAPQQGPPVGSEWLPCVAPKAGTRNTDLSCMRSEKPTKTDYGVSSARQVTLAK